jgi:two-component system response regulator YesN
MHATNGREALAFLTSEVVDLIISDWSMPEMDGLELLKVCKAEQIVRQRTAQ